MYVGVAGEGVGHQLGGSFVHDLQHDFRHFGQEVSERVSFGSEIRELHFQRLSVVHHHIVDGLFEDGVAVFVLGCAHILLETKVEFFVDLGFLDPLKERVSFCVFDVFNFFVLFCAIFVAIKASSSTRVIHLE